RRVECARRDARVPAVRRYSRLLIVPAMLVLIAFFIIPLVWLFLTSLHGYSATQGVVAQWTFANYIRFLSDPFYLDVLLRTVRVAVETTALCAVLGYPLALYLRQTSGAHRNYLILLL